MRTIAHDRFAPGADTAPPKNPFEPGAFHGWAAANPIRSFDVITGALANVFTTLDDRS